MIAPDPVVRDNCKRLLARLEPWSAEGRVRAVVGTLLEGEGVPARIGSVCRVQPEDGGASFLAEVVGFREKRFLLLPLGERRGVGPGARIRVEQLRPVVPAGDGVLGRVLDAMGDPIDGLGPLASRETAPLYARPTAVLRRQRIRRPLDVGVRAINAFATVGCGARIGLFAGSGVGKSTLLGQVARNTEADVRVIALVGERGREVREFVENDLGDALDRSVVVVATSDEPALRRVRAAHAATAIAERFRERGRSVLLLMDSVTRVCTALREIGLAAGEPPSTRGYPPSVWSELPRLLERAGTGEGSGSITGIYTVLVEGDDPNEPVADATRAILDGHLQLTRELAERGQFPALDVLASVSRVMPEVTTPQHRAAALRARDLLATYRRMEDLISIGAYSEGSDPAVDEARRLQPLLLRFLAQAVDAPGPLDASIANLEALVGRREVIAA